ATPVAGPPPRPRNARRESSILSSSYQTRSTWSSSPALWDYDRVTRMEHEILGAVALEHRIVVERQLGFLAVFIAQHINLLALGKVAQTPRLGNDLEDRRRAVDVERPSMSYLPDQVHLAAADFPHDHGHLRHR